MSAPTDAEWRYTIRLLERAAVERADRPSGAVLERVARHLREEISPAPPVWRCSCGERMRPIGALRVIGCPRCEGAAVP
jgi:hypothetical protein